MNRTVGMNGQWIGRYVGATSGNIHVNIDEDESKYFGVAYLFSDDPKFPPSVAYFATSNKDRELLFSVELIHAIDIRTGSAIPWENVKSEYPGMTFSKRADVEGAYDDTILRLAWITDTAGYGYSVLPRSSADSPSELTSIQQDWTTYKDSAVQLASKRRLLFRGQRKPWRLRTPFHRFGRAVIAYVRVRKFIEVGCLGLVALGIFCTGRLAGKRQ